MAAIILDDGELDRVLAHQGWPASWPKTRCYKDFLSGICAGPEGSRPKPARAPPECVSDAREDSQADPRSDLWDGRQDFPTGDLPA